MTEDGDDDGDDDPTRTTTTAARPVTESVDDDDGGDDGAMTVATTRTTTDDDDNGGGDDARTTTGGLRLGRLADADEWRLDDAAAMIRRPAAGERAGGQPRATASGDTDDTGGFTGGATKGRRQRLRRHDAAATRLRPRRRGRQGLRAGDDDAAGT